MNLRTWALQWGVPMAALAALEQGLGLDGTEGVSEGKSEAFAQSQVRLEASRVGASLWRNNVGALMDDTGRPVRFGLANDSPQLNAKFKSSDLIGIRPRIIGLADVGTTIGQFVAREMKEPGWRYAGTPREVAQLAYITHVASKGGDAAFATGPGTLS